mmetsp:Transcript_7856/g.24520  ORF Transcript_7856/g.24520 Transcript_7856/m.24520 type:complete len:320 (-) Transcript_7856:553-1512(-)
MGREDLPCLHPSTRVDLARALALAESATPVEMLVNPTLPTAGSVHAVMETATTGPPRYDFTIATASSSAFAFSAFRHRTHDGGYEYRVRMTPTEAAQIGAFCAQLKCSADCTRYTLCDDPSNFYSYPRELGAVCIGGTGGKGSKISVLMPRVLSSGAAAQFRVLRPDEDGIIARFLAGRAREHICALSGTCSTKNGGCVELSLPSADGEGAGEHVVVFRAVQANTALSVQYSHPLSAYQAFCIALSLVHHAQHRHNVTTARGSRDWNHSVHVASDSEARRPVDTIRDEGTHHPDAIHWPAGKCDVPTANAIRAAMQHTV